jgi:hypothetical protein
MRIFSQRDNERQLARSILRARKLCCTLFLTCALLYSPPLFANDECTGVPTNDIDYARMLAKKGDSTAEYVLGALRSREITKEEKNLYKDYLDEETQKWFHAAADSGNVKAQGYLCDRYTDLIRRSPEITQSEWGVSLPADLGKEIQWCFKAADHNYHPSQLALARFYWDGEGLPVDHEKSYFWYKIFGNDTAIPKRVIESLTQDQISSINKQAKIWRPQIPTEKEINTWHGSGWISKSVIEEVPLNIAGLICNGQARDCKIWDNCGDMVGIVCGGTQPKYAIANKITKKIINSCPNRTDDCKNLVPKEWTCNSPKNMPLSLTDQNKFPQYKNSISCGDILGVDNNSGGDGPYYFINKNTGKQIGSCSFWHGKCEPPKEWACGRPSNYGG